ncbi:ribonuclease T [Marssonina coronariae]|uniref:Ribonuclease T2-like n=1 Tax=Diplocarpon coronariae TaxID=2795749 RepID=A0A218Z8S1_9HELO|nr:ribonuclease T [Marssonina coronariae]
MPPTPHPELPPSPSANPPSPTSRRRPADEAARDGDLPHVPPSSGCGRGYGLLCAVSWVLHTVFLQLATSLYNTCSFLCLLVSSLFIFLFLLHLIPSWALAGLILIMSGRYSLSALWSLLVSASAVTATAGPARANNFLRFLGLPQNAACPDPMTSCQNTTVAQDLCCFNAPGGQLLLTQFWDTTPSTGPENSWTIHGLWPDHCDGTYDAYCDPAREYKNITAILEASGKTELLDYMSTFWKDYQNDDENLWEHEWNKHGTCINTLEPKCFDGYQGQEEVVNYFEIAARTYMGLNSYAILEDAGIVPSTTKTYDLAQIQDALTAFHGHPVSIACTEGRLDEIWYHFHVRGNIVTGDFVPAAPVGGKGDCAATGIRYVPKNLPATSTPTPSGAAPAPTRTPYSGEGFLQAYTGGVNKGCLIAAGTWYTTGTCATYTAAKNDFGAGFTLKTNDGPCDVVDGIFSCSIGNPAGTFTSVDGSLAYEGSAVFYAAAVPTRTKQLDVSTSVDNVEVSFVWEAR